MMFVDDCSWEGDTALVAPWQLPADRGRWAANKITKSWTPSIIDPTNPIIFTALAPPALTKSRYDEQRKRSLNVAHLVPALQARQPLNSSGEDPNFLTVLLNRVNSCEVVSETSHGSCTCVLLWLSLGFLCVSVAFQYSPLKYLMLLIYSLNTNLLKCAWLS